VLLSVLDWGYAVACPRCATAIAARGKLWAESPVEHLFVVALPFLLVVLVSVLANHSARLRARAPGAEP
jgi:hypothetical protein